ncbi:MAG: hypothetical protein A2156_03925 [Deltaproteobacteria bacterium RBG_16_48_10]|nr:MAG: hypothetical protein A2156_03925 [Deltaproteobacteria bacterium RBG_16_48_10]
MIFSMKTPHFNTNDGRPSLVFVTYSGLGDLVVALPLFWALRPHFKVLPVIQPQHRVLAQLFIEDEILEGYFPIVNSLRFSSDPLGHVKICWALSNLRPEVVLIYGKSLLALAAFLGFLRGGRKLFCDPMGFTLPTTGSFKMLTSTGNRTRDHLQFAEKLGILSRPDCFGFSRGAIDRILIEFRPNMDFPSYAVVAPWTSTAYRTAPLRFFRECIEIIVTEGDLPVVVTGTPQDHRAAANLFHGLKHKSVKNLVGATSLQEMLGLLAGARFLLTSDSGNLHLAWLVGTRSLAVFGPTAPERIFPEGFQERIVPIRLGLPCSPCEFSARRYRCPALFLQCMSGLEAAHVKNMLLKACQTSTGETGD